MTYMDEYAMLLKIKSDLLKLNKLVHDLLITDPTRSEVFVALSVLWERKDERGALSYAEKDPSHVRNQTESIGEAFKRHEQVHNLQKVNSWRAAFTEVGNLAGSHLQDDR